MPPSLDEKGETSVHVDPRRPIIRSRVQRALLDGDASSLGSGPTRTQIVRAQTADHCLAEIPFSPPADVPEMISIVAIMKQASVGVILSVGSSHHLQ